VERLRRSAAGMHGVMVLSGMATLVCLSRGCCGLRESLSCEVLARHAALGGADRRAISRLVEPPSCIVRMRPMFALVKTGDFMQARPEGRPLGI